MTDRRRRYLRHRFPPDIIGHAVRLDRRYCLSYRVVEDLLSALGQLTPSEYATQRQTYGSEAARFQ